MMILKPLSLKSFSKVLVSFVFLSTIYSLTHVAHAGPKEWLFKKIANIVSDVDITRTVNNMVAETVTGVPLSMIVQRNADEVYNCGIAKNVEAQGRVAVVESIASMHSITEYEAGKLVDAAVDATETPAYTTDNVCDFNSVSMASRNGGSLLAVGVTIDSAIESEVIPINLAVYFKDIARRTPILKDTAYAASYSIIGADLVLEIWKLIRNLAYGVVSLAMIVVGIMIMMRKKINPQTSITIQNAFPRLIMSIVLITFSYPIGATLASLAVPAISISKGFFDPALGATFTNLDIMGTILAMMCLTYPGFTGLAIAVFLLVCIGVCWVIALIKVLISYLRIMFATVTAPLSFAMGAIPGKESAITDWFKNIGVELGTIATTFFMIRLAFYVGVKAYDSAFSVEVGKNPFAVGIFEDGSMFSRAIIYSITPLVMIMCLITAMKMRGLVKTWILGDAAKKRR